jgi:transcriptional regulator with XRE-family HTH domain
MTPQELKSLRTRLGWSRDDLSRRLEISPSRLADYETGQTRTKPPRSAPIPKVVELACRWLEEHARPLDLEEWLALLRNTGTPAAGRTAARRSNAAREHLCIVTRNADDSPVRG